MNRDPHANARVLQQRQSGAQIGLVLLHGRGDSAAGIATLLPELAAAGAPPLLLVAPEAVGNQWYPHRFLEPLERNQPWLDGALATVERAVALLEGEGLSRSQMVIAGFSQGACLALEYIGRAGGRWGGAVGLSGGLIGAEVDPERYPHALAGTPIFLGCSDVDPHIPESRVQASARQLAAQGGTVTTRIYPGMPHTVNRDEIDWFADHLRSLQHSVT
jgi:phospholipase/carboxylesterase